MRNSIIALAGVLLFTPACSNNTPVEEEAIPPTLTTGDATAIFATGATLGGNITDAGNPAFVERGVCYGADENPTVNNNRTPVEGVDLGAFKVSVANLISKTTYHVRAYANTPNGIVYGNDVRFETTEAGTIAVQPALTTTDATDITSVSVIIGGNITNAGTPAYTERGVCYGKTPNPDVSNGKATSQGTGTGTGAYQVGLIGLDPNTTYYAKAYVICAGTPCYADNQVQFVTGPPVGPPVNTIYFNISTMQLDVNQTATLTYTIVPLNAGNQKVTWSSSNPSVAAVDTETGLITGIAVGAATITVTTDDGDYKANCTVTVMAENLLANPGFEDPADDPGIDSEKVLPANWESVPEEWFESYYSITSSDITPAQVGTHDALCDFKIRASLWYTQTYPGMQPVLTGNFTARIPSGTATTGTGGLYQVITVTPGATYDFGCDLAFRDNNGNGGSTMNSDMAVKILTADGKPLLDAGGKQIGIAYLSNIEAVVTGTANKQYFYVNSPSYNNGVNATVTIPAGITRVRFQVDQKNDHASSGKWSAVMAWDQCFFRQSK